MTTAALIHGAGGNAKYWSRVVPTLEAAGIRCAVPDLPAASAEADFTTYADAVTASLGDGGADVVISQSMGAFTAPIVAQRCGSFLIILVAPMIPAPWETPGQWGENVNLERAQSEYAAIEGFDPAFDLMTTFMHDVPVQTLAQIMDDGQPEQSPRIFQCPFPFDAWPTIPTRVIACTRDRLFPLPLTRRLAAQRLGINIDELDSGHLPGFAHPDELARKLLALVGTAF